MPAAVAVAERPSELAAPGADELTRQARSLLISDPRQALARASAAVRRADRGGDLAELAAARLARGDAHRLVGQREEALIDYHDAARLFRRLGRAVDAAVADASAVDCLSHLHRTYEALQLAARARRVFRRHGKALHSAILDEVVGLIYFLHDDYERALKFYERARPVLAAANRPRDLAALDLNAANALTQLDRLQEAEALYASAQAYYAAQGASPSLAKLDVNLGYLAYRQGRYGSAIDKLRRAADVFDRLGHVPLAIVTRLDLIETYIALNLLDEAASLAEEQLRLAGEAGRPHERARAAFYLATLRGRAGRVDDALASLRQAEASFAAQGNTIWRTRCGLGRAALLANRGQPADLAEALTLTRGAERVFARQGQPSRQAGARVIRARVELQRGQARAAEQAARGALVLADELGVPWLLFECEYILGRALRAQGDKERAFAAYRAAADALERVRVELQPEELRVSLMSDKTDLYQELVTLCLERAATYDALQFAELAKSRAFAERLAGSVEVDPRALGTADEALLERIARTRDKLAWLYARLSNGNNEPAAPGSRVQRLKLADMHRLRLEVDRCEAELVRLQRRLQPASRPRAAALGLRDTADEVGGGLAALRRRLPATTKVLEYFQAGDELLLFVFCRSRLTAYRLGLMKTIASLVDRLRFQTSKFNLGEAYLRAHMDELLANVQAVLTELYASLIGPAANELVDTQRMLVVPHGPLHYVPFHALLDPAGMPLVESVEVAYAPSASILASCYDRPALPAGLGEPLLVGLPDDSIPQVSGEIDALDRLLGPCLVLKGEAATERAFRDYAPRADIIHLASHAVFREDNPLFSAIRLADGWLSMNDLYSLRLQAALVTLSACETGRSEVLAGDELVGLSRGFFQAGAASVVVSLWAVNDASTARLMERFYTHLGRGKGPAGAMRLAQAELRRDYPHPYHWAPFLVIGRP